MKITLAALQPPVIHSKAMLAQNNLHSIPFCRSSGIIPSGEAYFMVEAIKNNALIFIFPWSRIFSHPEK